MHSLEKSRNVFLHRNPGFRSCLRLAARWARLNAAAVLLSTCARAKTGVKTSLTSSKLIFFFYGAGRRLSQRDERLLAVVSLLFGVGETNRSQGKC